VATPATAQSGRSSGVEHNLAKVGVEGSNPFARSSFIRNFGASWVGRRRPDCLYKRVALAGNCLPPDPPSRMALTRLAGRSLSPGRPRRTSRSRTDLSPRITKTVHGRLVGVALDRTGALLIADYAGNVV
jgi:hypothetical protein